MHVNKILRSFYFVLVHNQEKLSTSSQLCGGGRGLEAGSKLPLSPSKAADGEDQNVGVCNTAAGGPKPQLEDRQPSGRQR